MLWGKAEPEFVEYRKDKDGSRVNLVAPSKTKSVKCNAPSGIPKIAVRSCDCEGETHEIVANCINCGKLYCSGNTKLNNCKFCSGFVADPRSSEYQEWFEQQRSRPDFIRAIQQRDRMIKHES